MKFSENIQMMKYLTRPARPSKLDASVESLKKVSPTTNISTEEKDKNLRADVIDMMSPGPLKDELRGTYDPTQETYEEYLQRRAIQQIDRPLTGQAPVEDDSVLMAMGGRVNFGLGGEVKKFYETEYLNPDSIYNKFKTQSQFESIKGKWEELTPGQRRNIIKTYQKYKDKSKNFNLYKRGNYITLTDLAKLVGKEGRVVTHPVTGKKRILGGLREQILEPISREASGTRRNLGSARFAENFLMKDLKMKAVDLGQGKPTWIIKNPNETQLQKIKDYYLRKGSKYGITPEVEKRVYQLFRDPITSSYLKKGKVVPEKIAIERFKKLGMTPNQGSFATYRLAQVLNGTEFLNVGKLKLPVNKKIATSLFRDIDRFPWQSIYADAPYRAALDAITNDVGDTYFDTKDLSSMKRQARKILNEAGIPVYDPRKKNPYGVNLNEIAGVKATARTGMAPYGTFVNILEGKLNTQNYALFVKDFEKHIEKLKSAVKSNRGNPEQVIKNFEEKRKKFIKNTRGLNEANVPKLSIKSPTQVYGLQRISELKGLGLNLEDNFAKTGVTIDVGKARTIKEFLANPNAKGIYDKLSGTSPKMPFIDKVFAASVLPAMIGSQYIPEALRDLGVVRREYESTAGIGDIPIKEIGPSLTEQVTAGTATAGTAAAAGKGMFGKYAQQIAKGIIPAAGVYFSPTNIARGYAFDGEKLDLKDPESRLGLEAELAFAPALVKGSELATSKIKNQAVKGLAERALNLGMRAPTALRIARAASPIGIASLLGEAAYGYGKWAKGEIERIKNMSPEERERYDAEQQMLFSGIGMASGGRAKFQEAGFVQRMSQAADPRNIPYYAQKALKGLASGVEMAIKVPAAVGVGIGKLLQQKPSMEMFEQFTKAIEPSATQALSEKFGLEKLINKSEETLMKERPSAIAVGDVLELGAEMVAPATGYIKLIEDGGSKLYKILKASREGKPIDPVDFEEVATQLSKAGIDRRDFLKITGGASVYGLAKYIGIVDAVKIVEKMKPIRMLGKSSSRMPEWLPSFASKILDDTNSVFKQIDEDLVEITNKNLPDVSIGKYSNGRWEISGYNEYGKPYIIDYEPPSILEDGTKYAGDFSVFDNVPSRVGPDDVEFDSELVESIDDVLGGTSKLEEWTTGAKKKDLTPGEKRVIEAEGRAEAEYDAWKESEDFVDE